MKINLVGIVSDELVKAASEGEIFPYVVCGVDVYKHTESITDDEVIDESRQCPLNKNMYFSGRHYRLIDLLDSDDYNPKSSINDVRTELRELNAEGIGCLTKDFLEQDDCDTAYVLTPLSDLELNELIR